MINPYRSTIIPPPVTKRVWEYSFVQAVLGALAVIAIIAIAYFLFIGARGGLYWWGHYAAVHFDHRMDISHMEYGEFIGNGVRWILMPVLLVLSAIFIPTAAYQVLKAIGSLLSMLITERLDKRNKHNV